jgi:hypothetical protein
VRPQARGGPQKGCHGEKLWGVWRQETISVGLSVGPRRGFVLDDCVRRSALVTPMAGPVKVLTQFEERGYLLFFE